jgi:hypothetical protein
VKACKNMPWSFLKQKLYSKKEPAPSNETNKQTSNIRMGMSMQAQGFPNPGGMYI